VLSPREQQISRLVAEGHSTRNIADRLSLSAKTVDNHRTNLMRKLDVHSRMELVRYAVRLGLIDVEQWKE
jgi:DNA-binding CsgD family transcriptional regulator